MRLIRINLLVLGVFAPILATVFEQAVRFSQIIITQFGQAGILAWLLSMMIATRAYRRGRRREFKEQGLAENDSEPLVIDELLAYNSVSIGFSIASIVLLIIAVVGVQLQFTNPRTDIIFASIGFGFVVIVGQDILTFTVAVAQRFLAVFPYISKLQKKIGRIVRKIDQFLGIESESAFLNFDALGPGRPIQAVDDSVLAELTTFACEELQLSYLHGQILATLALRFGKTPFTEQEALSEMKDLDTPVDQEDLLELTPRCLIQLPAEDLEEKKFKVAERSLSILAGYSHRLHIRIKDDRREEYLKSGEYIRYIFATISRVVTGYGVKPARVISVSQVVIILFAIIYYLIGISPLLPSNGSMSVIESLYFSIVSFTPIGPPSYQPDRIIQYISALEGLVGTFLIMTFAYVFSRRSTQ